MYSQGTQAVSHRRNVRYYSASPASRRRRDAPSQERVRLLQLAVCLALFLTIFLWKGVFPQKLGQVRDDLLALITTDLDLQGTLAGLGESLAGEGTVLSELGSFCLEVFGAEPREEPPEPAPPLPPLPEGAGLLEDELHFLSRRSDAAARISHYADLTRYGLTAVPVEPAPEPEPEPEPAPPEEPAAVPAVGTVISVSDYSGEPLPNNYTMDQLSLGKLETVTPVMGHLNSEYGYRDHPINGRYQFHGGVDIGGQSGDPIGAFAAGTVEYTGEDDSYGLYLQLDHGNGVKSFYAHCSRIVVTKGQVVALGEKVAEIGSSGSATGPHLHLELKYNKMHLNPVYYVDILEQ